MTDKTTIISVGTSIAAGGIGGWLAEYWLSALSAFSIVATFLINLWYQERTFRVVKAKTVKSDDPCQMG